MGSRGRAGYGPGMDPLATGLEGADLRDYLSACREGVLAELRARLPPDGPRTGGLYGLVLDYPLRDAKALRPALAVATARALLDDAVRKLQGLGAFERYEEVVRMDRQVALDLVGDSCHAVHGLDLTR